MSEEDPKPGKKIGLSKTPPDNPASYRYRFKQTSAGAGVDSRPAKRPAVDPADPTEKKIVKAEKSSSAVSETVVESVKSNLGNSEIKKVKTMFTRDPKQRKSSKVFYAIDGTRFSVGFPKALFGGAEPPATINGDTVFTGSAPKPKLSKEDRAAQRAAETPADKVARARKQAEAAARRLAKAEEAASVTA